MNIIEFYQTHTVDENFDETYYEEQCPSVVDFYEPYASSLGIQKKEKYFFHYYAYGKDMGLLPKDEPIERTVSVLIACKNRETNLQKVIGSWHTLECVKEIILVDYSSDKKIEIDGFEKLHIVRVEDEKLFNLGRAYNLAFDFSTCDFIIKADSDYLLIDESWLDKFFKSVQAENFYIRGDYLFSRYTSGFFIICRKYFEYFREDLNGYGYDEIDLYNRIKDIHPSVKEITFFDIDKYIYHIPHDHVERSFCYINKDVGDSEEKNRTMCELYSPHKVSRVPYFSFGESVRYHKKQIDKTFCINLDDRVDRWEEIENNHKIERISAVDTRNNNSILKEYGLELNPCNLSALLYIKHCKGSVGAYLSHYSIWKKIVQNNIQHTLILEDDVEVKSFDKIFTSNVIFEDYELINFSKRLSWDYIGKRLLFDGAESYLLSLEGAKKLIMATEFPILLSRVVPQSYDSIRHEQMDNADWSHSNSIVAPVDKFIGYCCENKADERIRIKSYMYPIIECEDYGSDIDAYGPKVWDMDYREATLALQRYKQDTERKI